MATNINTLKIPLIPMHVAIREVKKSKEVRDSQINELVVLGKEHWIVKNMLGYFIIQHEHVSAILRDGRWHQGANFLHSLNARTDPNYVKRSKQSLVSMEGEDHTRVKRIILSVFSQKKIESLRGYTVEVLNELIDTFIDNEECDLVTEICEKLPMRVLCKLLGFADSDYPMVEGWAKDMISALDHDPELNMERILQSEKDFYDYLIKIIEEKKNNPSDDLISRLILARDEEGVLDDSELIMTAGTMMAGGIDTVITQMGLVLSELISNYPDKILDFKNNPSSIINYVNEQIRLTPSIRTTSRIASEDIEYNGILFPKNTVLLMSLASSNLDESKFSCPYTMDDSRDNSVRDTMSFGSGVHYCMGPQLARLQIEEAIRIISNRMENIEITDKIKYKSSHSTFYGPVSIPIKFSRYK